MAIKDTNKIRMRKQDVVRRVTTSDSDYSYCHVIGCKNPPTARTGKGLNRLYCRKHEDHFERHGSYVKASYKASEVNPYRRIALKWIKAHENDPYVAKAILKIESLYNNAGLYVEAFRLQGLKPETRAKAAWARLREKGVDSRIPLSIWLAIEMVTRSDPQGENKDEYKRVQAAKVIHRQASGTHKRWEHVRSSDGKVWVEELHKYPKSRGLVLWHIGKQLEKAAELVVDRHMDSIMFR
jgi:hypothetical protein